MKNGFWASTHPGYIGGIITYKCDVCGCGFGGGSDGGHKFYDKHIAEKHPEKAIELMCAKEYRKIKV